MLNSHGFGARSSGGDPARPVRSMNWSTRLSTAAALLVVGLLSMASPASAAPGEPIGRWVSAGAPVDLGDGARWFSDRAGAAVEVVCVDGAQEMKVRGYFGQGEDVLTGYTSTKNVKVVDWEPRGCTWFD